jgi:DNA-binding Lrp family transcriptional regulator
MTALLVRPSLGDFTHGKELEKCSVCLYIFALCELNQAKCEIMAILDPKDREMIALLKADSRASITTLANTLGLSRTTAQKRLDRLVSTGVIQRFTVDLDAAGQGDVIRAVMLIALDLSNEPAVIRRLRNLREITSLHTTNGTWALVAQVEVQSLPEFDSVLRKVGMTPGVLNSETCLLLDSAKG